MAGQGTFLWRRCRPCSWTRSTWVRALLSPDPTAHPESGASGWSGEGEAGRTTRGSAPRGAAPRSSPSDVALTPFGLADLLQTPGDSTSARFLVQGDAALSAAVIGRWVCGPTHFHRNVLRAAASWDSSHVPRRGAWGLLWGSSCSALLPSSSQNLHIVQGLWSDHLSFRPDTFLFSPSFIGWSLFYSKWFFSPLTKSKQGKLQKPGVATLVITWLFS